jgi:hypothetical protein
MLYSFATTQVVSADRRVALLWKHDRDRTVVYLFPLKVCVLVERDKTYVYLEDGPDTYLSALRTDAEKQTTVKILNHKYLVAWNHEVPRVLSYPEHLTDPLQIVSWLPEKI